MITRIIIAIAAYFVGVFGWAQVVGSLQNIRTSKRFLITLILWIMILGAVAYFAIARFDAMWSLLIGYAISLVQILKSGRIE